MRKVSAVFKMTMSFVLKVASLKPNIALFQVLRFEVKEAYRSESSTAEAPCILAELS